MNRIYWDLDKISMLTDHLDAVSHSHCMIQFFLGLEDNLEIKVAGKKLICQGIIVNKNVKHSFQTNKKLHFTCLFEPVSEIALQMNYLLQDKDYYILNEIVVEQLKKASLNMLITFDSNTYQMFMEKLYKYCGLKFEKKECDERIMELIGLLERCDCEDHMIEKYASELAISSSRLSHLFREQIGIPIKNYLTLHQLERAFMDLLAGQKISDAAMNAGFDSPSHFAATVKRMMGVPARSTMKYSEFLKVY